MRVWLLLLVALQPATAGRRYHEVPLTAMATTQWTHVCTVGPVIYVRRMADGDLHVTLDDGRARVVAEIIPALPLPRPRKGQQIRVCGIARWDRHHGWPEVHPVERWEVVGPRQPPTR